jgi:PleD family two-component response regulator
MHSEKKRRILAVLDDLFFRVKIEAAAKQEGLPIDFVQSEKDVLAKAADDPLLIILDLNCLSVQPLSLIAALKADESTKGISLLGYVSHVQGELRQKAQESGCDVVMARSAFSQNLPQILKQHAGAA